MGALSRFRAGSVYTPSGVAPDQGFSMGMNGASLSASASAGVDSSVQVAGVLLLALLAIVVVSHVVAKS